MARFLIFPILGYLLGSIPTGFLYGKWLRGIDIRKYGSGNVGATNAARVLGRTAFVIVLVLDIAKGVLAVMIPRWLGMDESVRVLAGLAAVFGHSYTVFLRFRGGKGVATSAGVFFALAPFVTTAALIVFLIVLALGRYISLASICGAASLLAAGIVCFLIQIFYISSESPTAASAPEGLLVGKWTLGAITLASLLVLWRHRANIQRLRSGTEPKAGQRVEVKQEAES